MAKVLKINLPASGSCPACGHPCRRVGQDGEQRRHVQDYGPTGGHPESSFPSAPTPRCGSTRRFSVTATFNSPVSGFTIDDISVVQRHSQTASPAATATAVYTFLGDAQLPGRGDGGYCRRGGHGRRGRRQHRGSPVVLGHSLRLRRERRDQQERGHRGHSGLLRRQYHQGPDHSGHRALLLQSGSSTTGDPLARGFSLGTGWPDGY